MDRIIIRGEITGPFQRIYVYKDGEKVDSIGVLFEDLVDTALSFLRQYEITQIDLSGHKAYLEEIEKNIKEAIAMQYNFPAITFRYV